MYVYINTSGQIGAFVNTADPNFPDVPIEERYSKDFLDNCVIKSEEYVEEH